MERLNEKKAEVINIVHQNCVKSVVCDKPCSEGYEAGNIVSKSFIDRSKGFLAERFIKPPVTLTFSFKNEIEIKYIAMLCKVGAQKSTGIELFTKSTSSSDEYVSVASGILQDLHDGFVFHGFDQNISNKYGKQYYLRTFKPKSQRSLSSVTSLKVKIFRTNGLAVPALCKLEIWGCLKEIHLLPCESERFSTSSLIKCSVIKTDEQKDLYTFERNSLQNKSSSRKSYSHLNDNKVSLIPEDFIDPITCDLMIQPVILPSGKIIDNSTLELYLKAEQSWGRGPNDPFTSISFSECRKPVAASELKVRIDQFLSKNCNNVELQNVPRIVGGSLSEMLCREPKNFKASVSKLIPSSTSKGNSSTSNSDDSTTEIAQKRRKMSIVPECDKHTVSEETSNKPKSDLTTSTNCLPSLLESKTSTKNLDLFQKMNEQSLELSLKSTLSKLPKLTDGKPKPREETLVMCNSCKENNQLFKIVCSHFVCRGCLISSKEKRKICSICKLCYRSEDIQKVHVL